ncbi:MAG: fatty-acyl-CoA synthase [Kribbellaceae bacterium]|nr:fatty-acyl-CoA synthase [Kribbellaceae bacterium]
MLGETIGQNLRRTVAAYGDREAMVEVASGRRWTYDEYGAEVDVFARGLMARGIGKGDRVGIWAPNCAEWTITQYATAAIGAILVNINPAYRTHELSYALNQSGVKLLVSATEFKTSDYRKMVDEVRPDCAALEDVVYIGTPDWVAVVEAATHTSPEDLEARANELSFDDPINIQYTSGTTGFPKGATLSHHNILNNGYFVTETIAFGPDDRLCIPVPFYHCFGMVMANLGCTTHGACMVIPGPAFDPAATLQAVQDERCTGLYGVPTMFIAELGLPDFASYDLSSLRTGVMAGSPCPVEVMKRCVADMHMAEVAICYGMTETSPVSTQTRRDDDLDRRTSTVGRVMPHVEVKLVDPATGLVVPRGEPGELCTRGYSVMLGYWDDPEKTAEAIDQARWMHTGDLAVMREDGYVNIVGRIKDMVIRGGENVYPREIEEFLYTHPDIADVQVIGVPDEKYGEELCAWIKLKDGAAELDAANIREFATGKLAHYKIPRYVLLVDEFPMTVTGKIRKVEMREKSLGLLGLS